MQFDDVTLDPLTGDIVRHHRLDSKDFHPNVVADFTAILDAHGDSVATCTYRIPSSVISLTLTAATSVLLATFDLGGVPVAHSLLLSGQDRDGEAHQLKLFHSLITKVGRLFGIEEFSDDMLRLDKRPLIATSLIGAVTMMNEAIVPPKIGDPMRVGAWLIELGVRNEDYSPTSESLQSGLAKVVTAPNGSEFYAWRRDVLQRLEQFKQGEQRSLPSRLSSPPPSMIGPFTFRLNEGDGYSILNANGEECVYGRGQQHAAAHARLLTLAVKHRKFGK